MSIDIQHNYLVIYRFAGYETDSFELQFNLFNPSDEDVEIAIEKRFRQEAADDFAPDTQGYEVSSHLVFKLEIIEGRAVAMPTNISAYIDHYHELWMKESES